MSLSISKLSVLRSQVPVEIGAWLAWLIGKMKMSLFFSQVMAVCYPSFKPFPHYESHMILGEVQDI